MLAVVQIQVPAVDWASMPRILISPVFALFSQMPPYIWILLIVLLLLGGNKVLFGRSESSPQHYEPDDYDNGEPDEDEDDFDDER
jgi:hypothetical protein